MSEPKWTPIPGCDGYAASGDGSIWSTGTNWRGYGARRLTPILDEHGYLRVRMHVGGRRVKRAVHQLVALAHIGPRPSKAHEIRHLDGAKTNNASENLAWGTRKDNADDRARHDRTRNGFIAGTVDREAHRRACQESWRARHG